MKTIHHIIIIMAAIILLMCDLPMESIQKLQFMQNAAARLPTMHALILYDIYTKTYALATDCLLDTV